jgi:cell division protein FtsA
MSTGQVIALKRGPGRPLARQEPIGVLDIGTSKMCCLVARLRGDGGFAVQGIGYQQAEGLRAGEVVDTEAVESSILAVVHEAEKQAGHTLREVVVGISAGRPRSQLATVELDLAGRAVTSADLARALAHARAEAQADGALVLHALPVEITLDGSQPLREPRGMIGRRLRVAAHLVGAAAAPVHNLIATVERCHLEVAGVVAAPYAAALGCLSEDEAMLGALVIDMGSGVTGVARFAGGRLREIHAVPLGGSHVTQDLAFGLSIGRSQAERLKTLYGSVLPRAGDAHQRLEVTGLGDPDDPPAQIVTRAMLTEIVRPRVEEIFQLVRARLEAGSLPPSAPRLVLTGGASQLEGVVELAEESFGLPARAGRARSFNGSQSALDLAAGTTAAGLLVWASRDDGGLALGPSRGTPMITARLARLGQWLRENF